MDMCATSKLLASEFLYTNHPSKAVLWRTLRCIRNTAIRYAPLHRKIL